MNKDKLISSKNEYSQSQQIYEIIEMLEAIKSQIEKLPTKQEKGVRFEDIIKNLEDSINLAKSIRYQMISKGRVPTRAFNRLLEKLKLLDSYVEIFI